MDASRGQTYTAPERVYQSQDNYWANAYRVAPDLGLFSSNAGYWSKSDRRLVTDSTHFGPEKDDSAEITDKDLISKFKTGASKVDFEWQNSYKRVGCLQLLNVEVYLNQSLENSYWAVININKDKYSSPDIHLRFKNTTFKQKDWIDITVNPYKFEHKMLHFEKLEWRR